MWMPEGEQQYSNIYTQREGEGKNPPQKANKQKVALDVTYSYLKCVLVEP